MLLVTLEKFARVESANSIAQRMKQSATEFVLMSKRIGVTVVAVARLAQEEQLVNQVCANAQTIVPTVKMFVSILT